MANKELPFITSAEQLNASDYLYTVQSTNSRATDVEDVSAFGRRFFQLISRTTTAEPGSPGVLDAYLVPASATGTDWAGEDGNIAEYRNSRWEFKTPAEGWAAWVADEDGAFVFDGTIWRGIATEGVMLACSDRSTALGTGTNVASFTPRFDMKVLAVYAELVTAQASGTIFTVDINEAGTSILSTKLTIDNTETDSNSAATAAVISDSDIAAHSKVSVDIDQIGDGTAIGLIVTVIGCRA